MNSAKINRNSSAAEQLPLAEGPGSNPGFGYKNRIPYLWDTLLIIDRSKSRHYYLNFKRKYVLQNRLLKLNYLNTRKGCIFAKIADFG